jgi:hypothetical protein
MILPWYKYTYLKNCEDNADKHNRKKHSDEPDQAYCVTTYK